MPLTDRTNSVTSIERDELLAQHIACRYLVAGCQNALFDLGLKASEASDLGAESVDQRAVKILEAILSSWRGTAEILDRLQLKQRWLDDDILDDWSQLTHHAGEEQTPGLAARDHARSARR